MQKTGKGSASARGPPSRPLTVGDLFCGAGGFSEGFEQAGFRILWGVDNWPPAVRTFRSNHPDARAIDRNIVSLSPLDLEPVDVLIGSPPCVHFSPANRGGNGDRAAGMRLVRRFLTFVRVLRPKYWVMENVPGLRGDLEAEIIRDTIRLNSGTLAIPVRKVLNAAELGTPQLRRRLYSGCFPIPLASGDSSGNSGIPLKRVLECLPDPTRVLVDGPARIDDPVYPEDSIPIGKLTDHLEDSRWALSNDDLRAARRQKLFHAVYGKMAFPDDVTRPCRTITATRTRGSRSTIVIPFGSFRKRRFRTLTLRESASVQGFPLSYQFWGDSMGVKDALVGNAVPPPVARAIAEAILFAEGREPPSRPVIDSILHLPPRLSPVRMRADRTIAARRFRGVVEVDWRHDHRVELDNEFPPNATGGKAAAAVSWDTRIYIGYAKRYKCYQISFRRALHLASALTHGSKPTVPPAIMVSAVLPVLEQCLNGFVDGPTLQAAWADRPARAPGPDRLLVEVARAVDNALPKRRWRDVLIPISASEPVLSGSCVAKGTEALAGQPFPISVRLGVATVTLAVLCERLNSGTHRLERLHAMLVAEDSPSLFRSLRPADRANLAEFTVSDS